MSQVSVVANWKMNPSSVKEALTLAKKIEQASALHPTIQVSVAVPFPFLAAVGAVCSHAKLSAQDAFWEDPVGAYTGEVSLSQLQSVGVSSVIVGHSERRMHLGETDEMIHKKAHAVLERGMRALLCVGERERAGSDIPQMVEDQITSACAGMTKKMIQNLVVVYEPIWAISTTPGADPASADDAFRARLAIQKILTRIFGRAGAEKIRIFYGGSVTGDDVVPYINDAKMDGVLVGGASLVPQKFEKILKSLSG